MHIGKVVSKVVSTIKNAAFEGRPLLLVQPMGMDLSPKGAEVLCIDFIGVDQGEIVLMMKEGSSVQQMLKNDSAPADAAIIAVVDTVTLHEKVVFSKVNDI